MAVLACNPSPSSKSSVVVGKAVVAGVTGMAGDSFPPGFRPSPSSKSSFVVGMAVVAGVTGVLVAVGDFVGV